MTMASTLPAEVRPSTSGHQASTLRRMSASPPSMSLRCVRSAPQQPAPSATSVWMPAASSTRAVALLMLGIIAGCTQPSSISTLRGCSRVGHWWLRALPLAGTLCFRLAGSSGRSNLPAFIAGPNSGEVRPSFSSQRTAFSPRGRSTRSSTILRPMSTRWPYSHAAGAGGLAVAAGQAAVKVQLRAARHRRAFEHLLHQVDAPARAVEFVAEQLVGGAGGGAEAAVHALAQDGFGRVAVARAFELGGQLGLHGGFESVPVARRAGRTGRGPAA